MQGGVTSKSCICNNLCPLSNFMDYEPIKPLNLYTEYSQYGLRLPTSQNTNFTQFACAMCINKAQGFHV